MSSQFKTMDAKYTAISTYNKLNEFIVYNIPYTDAKYFVYNLNLYGSQTQAAPLELKPVFDMGFKENPKKFSKQNSLKFKSYDKMKNKKEYIDFYDEDTGFKNISNKFGLYFIYDNGGYSYQVHIYPKNIEVYNTDGKLIKNIKNYKHVFLRKDIGDKFYGTKPYKYECPGILIEMSGLKYIHIGYKITTFKTEEKIYNYIPHIGNSDVLYPYAISDLYYYIFDEKWIQIDKRLIYNLQNIYYEYYSINNNKLIKKLT